MENRNEVRHKVRNDLQTIKGEADDDPMYPQPLRDRLRTIREKTDSISQTLREVGL